MDSKLVNNAIVKNSLIVAGVVVAVDVLVYATGFYDNMPGAAGIISGVVSIGAWVYGARWAVLHKRTANEGFIDFGAGFAASMLFALVFSALSALFQVVYLGYISPEVMIAQYNQILEAYEQQGMPDQVIEMITNAFSVLASPAGIFFTALFGGMFTGLIVSLIAGLVLKREKPIIF